MNITKENIDPLNTIVKVDIVAEDYKDKVTKVLNDYRKKANIPGFRKGHIPMGMVKKQYGKSIMIDEVNKLLQEKLNKFLTEEHLDILGDPLPVVKDDFSWDAEKFSFEFELGLAPEFDLDIKSKNEITEYKIEITEELIEKEIENIQARYGKLIPLEKVEEHSKVTGTFINEEKGISKEFSFPVDDLKEKKNKKKLIDAKVCDIIELDTKEFFEKEVNLQQVLEITKEEADNSGGTVRFTIKEINKMELADLNQELFDKVFPDGSIKTIAGLKIKIKEDAEKQFQQQADQQLLNAVTEYLIENTKFDLPAKFLQRWLQITGKKELTTEEAKEEYTKSEKGLRYQLIESKIMKDNNIKLEYAELLDYTKEVIRLQMTRFGNINREEEELNNIAVKVLSDKDETKRLKTQLLSQKMLSFYKENMKFKIREISYEDFIKEIYK